MQLHSLLLVPLVLIVSLHMTRAQSAPTPKDSDGYMYDCRRGGIYDCQNGGTCNPADGSCNCGTGATDNDNKYYDCSTLSANPTADCGPGYRANAGMFCVSSGGSNTVKCKADYYYDDITDSANPTCKPRIKFTCETSGTGFKLEYRPLDTTTAPIFLNQDNQKGCDVPTHNSNAFDQNTMVANPYGWASEKAWGDCGITNSGASDKPSKYEFGLLITSEPAVITGYDVIVRMQCTKSDTGSAAGFIASPITIERTFTNMNQEFYSDGTVTATVLKEGATEVTHYQTDDVDVGNSVILRYTTTGVGITIMSCEGYSPDPETAPFTFFDGCTDTQSKSIVWEEPKDRDAFSVGTTQPFENKGDATDVYMGVRAFKLNLKDDKVIIACIVLTCTTNTGSSDCPAKAASGGDECDLTVRKKREASRPITNSTQYSKATAVLNFRDSKINAVLEETSDSDDHVDNTSFVIATAVLGALLLIAYVLISLLIRAVWCKDGHKSESRDDLRPVTPAYGFQIPRVEAPKY